MQVMSKIIKYECVTSSFWHCSLCIKGNSDLASNRMGQYFIAIVWNLDPWNFNTTFTIIPRLNPYASYVNNNKKWMWNLILLTVASSDNKGNTYLVRKSIAQYFIANLWNFDPWNSISTFTIIPMLGPYASYVHDNKSWMCYLILLTFAPCAGKGNSYLAIRGLVNIS